MARSTEPHRHVTHFGGRRIEFAVEWRERRHMAIEVNPDCSVVVIAPAGTDLSEVLGRVRRRAAWIARQLDYFDRFRPLAPARRYVAGETHLYLGRQYRLKLVRSEEDGVKLLGRYLHVFSTRPNESGHTKRLLDDWYRTHAHATFQRRLVMCLEAARFLNLLPPRVIIRRIKTRWGSCSRKGTVLLNTELIRAPLDCIDYVIAHELCHLKVHEHTPAFYRLLSRCMPDWERRKARLERVTL